MSEGTRILFHYDFTKSDYREKYNPRVSADGCISKDCDGLVVNSNTFTAHNPGLFDHIKLLEVFNETYEASDEELIYEGEIAARQIITPQMIPDIYHSRIRSIPEDHRLCSSGIVVYDEDSLLTAKILFTDDYIYGYYERRPTYKPNWSNIITTLGDYAAFTSIIPLTQRSRDFSVVGIGICKTFLKFYVNRKEIFCVSKLGCRLDDKYQVSDFGGYNSVVVPGTLSFGFGNFSYLDHNIPNNYARNYVVDGFRSASGLAPLVNKYREPYASFTGERVVVDETISFAYTGTDPSYFVFGQGMIMNIRYLTVYVKDNGNCCESERCSIYDDSEKPNKVKLKEVMRGVKYHRKG